MQGESLKGGSFCEEKVEPPVDRSKTKTEGKGKRGKEGGASGAAPLSFFLPPPAKNVEILNKKEKVCIHLKCLLLQKVMAK